MNEKVMFIENDWIPGKKLVGTGLIGNRHYTVPIVQTFGVNKDEFLWFDLFVHLKVLL